MLAEWKQYSRMASAIRKTLQTPPPHDPEEMARVRLREREQTFLKLLDRVVYPNPRNPYNAMFRMAGCTRGDLEGEISRHGLRPTLTKLRESGVYLLHEELKGRQPIVRGGRTIEGSTDDFRNPHIRGVLQTSTGGSTGQPLRSPRSLESRVFSQVYRMLEYRAFRMEGSARVLLRPILPNHYGLMDSILSCRWGGGMDHWFSEGSNLPTFRPYRWLTRGMLEFARLHGSKVMLPEYLPIDDFSPVARHVEKRKSEGRRVFLAGNVSQLVRVTSSALEKGCDISGTVFLCSGEALTEGKMAVFNRAGVRPHGQYAINEFSRVGLACPEHEGNTVHLLEDAVEVIARRGPSPYDESVEVNSLHFTSLAPYAHIVLINFEVDDSGEVLEARCDCLYSRLGYRTLVTDMNSFGKVSPLGMTFHAQELQNILELRIPERFGGGPGDYQLVECEGPDSQTQLVLHVSPRVNPSEPAAIGRYFLELMRPRYGGALATRAWVHAGGIKVVVAEPYKNLRGKVHAVRLLAASNAARSARA